MKDISEFRKTQFDVDLIFPKRWSPRAMSGESITDPQLMSLFEAARWAPSARNEQPWRFIYAKRDTPSWNLLFNLLVEDNQVWAKNAAALIVIISKTTHDYKNRPNKTHTYDTGSAWQSLALQASSMGLIAHGMAGFDYERAKNDLKVPDGYKVEAMAAIGKPGNKEDLPEELQQRESPSDRKKIEEFAFEGEFKKET